MVGKGKAKVINREKIYTFVMAFQVFVFLAPLGSDKKNYILCLFKIVDLEVKGWKKIRNRQGETRFRL